MLFRSEKLRDRPERLCGRRKSRYSSEQYSRYRQEKRQNQPGPAENRPLRAPRNRIPNASGEPDQDREKERSKHDRQVKPARRIHAAEENSAGLGREALHE